MVYEAICPRFDSWLGDSFARTPSHAFVLADSRLEPPKLVASGSTPDGGAAFVHSHRAYTHRKSGRRNHVEGRWLSLARPIVRSLSISKS